MGTSAARILARRRAWLEASQLLWRCAAFAQVGVCLKEFPPAPVAHHPANSKGFADEAARRSPVRLGFSVLLAVLPLGWALAGLALEPSTPLANYGRSEEHTSELQS